MQTSPDTIIKIGYEQYEIVRLQRQNLKDLTRLHQEVYGPVPADHYLKKYDSAYTGTEYVGFIAYNSDHQPIAYYGVIPCLLQFKNTIQLAAQSADTMTHPKFRQKGMFLELSRLTFELCRSLGIRLIFGFPNQHSYHTAVEKLGWIQTDTMCCFSIPVKTLPLERVSKKVKVLRSIYRSYQERILSKLTLPLAGIANSALEDGYGSIRRTEAYLAHKTSAWNRVILIGKVKLWISTRHGIMVGDMEGVQQSNFGETINGLQLLAKQMGVQQIQFHVSPGTVLHELFSTHYKGGPSYPVLFQDFGSAIPIKRIKFTLADIDIF